MMEDTIIEELHKIREEIAAEHNYDLHEIVAALRRNREKEGWQVVTLPPNLVAPPEDCPEPDEQRLPEPLSTAHRVS